MMMTDIIVGGFLFLAITLIGLWLMFYTLARFGEAMNRPYDKKENRKNFY